jgi:hypothetical protein
MSYYNHTRILNVNSPYAHCQLPSALGSLSIDPVGCDHSYTQELVIAAAYWKSHWPVFFFLAKNSQISSFLKGPDCIALMVLIHQPKPYTLLGRWHVATRTIVDLTNKWDLDHPKSWVVRKLSSSSSACFAQELQQFTKRSSCWFFVLAKSFP